MQSFVSFFVLLLINTCLVVKTAENSASLYNFDGWIPLPFTQTENTPTPPISKSWQDPTTLIFIGISHYRDKRCTNVLDNLFSKAKYPDRIRVGIIQHIHTEEDGYDCLKDYCNFLRFKRHEKCTHESQIKLLELTHLEARGPNYGRYLQQTLIEDEEFCLQIDSHVDFVENWDVELTKTWSEAENEYAIISTVLPDISLLTKENCDELPHLCQAKFDESSGLVTNLPPTLVKNLPKPLLSPLWSAGFSFSKCHAEKKTPNDPEIQLLYDGDEFIKYARYWTKGYDVYTPNRLIAGHDYSNSLSNYEKKKDPMAWKKNGMTKEFSRILYDRSIERISTVLGFPSVTHDISTLSTLVKYGLGFKRSLDQFIQFTGIDTRNKIIYGDRCRELQWVPYIPDKDPYTDSSDIWGFAPETLPAGGPNVPLKRSGHVELFPERAFTKAYSDALAAAAASNSSYNHNPLSLGDKEISMESVREKVSDLWWVFSWIDAPLEGLMVSLDQQFGPGHGKRVLKVVLLLIPIFALIFFGAFWVLCAGFYYDIIFY